MPLFFYLFTVAINLWHQKFITADASVQCLSIINMILSDEDKVLIKKFVSERVHSEKVDRRISWEKLDKVWC